MYVIVHLGLSSQNQTKCQMHIKFMTTEIMPVVFSNLAHNIHFHYFPKTADQVGSSEKWTEQ